MRKKKAKGGKGKGNQASAAQALNLSEGLKGTFDREQKQMQDAVHWFEEQIKSVQGVSASPALLDGIQVQDADGATHSLESICTVTIADPRTLLVILPDPKMAKAVGKAITDADLGVHPQITDAGFKVPVPKMNREYRESLVKQLGKHAETAKDRVRRARKSGMDIAKKEKKSGSADDAKLMEQALQQYTDEAVAQIVARLEKKTKELETQ